MDDEFDLETSPLCRDLSEGDKTVRVEIYRGGGSDWHLEVVDQFGNSTVWHDQFPTDEAALKEAESAIREDGIDSLIGEPE